VDNAPRPPLPSLQGRDGLPVGLPVVDDYGQAQVRRHLQLLRKAPPLDLRRGQIAEKIQADLPVCHHRFIPGQSFQYVVGIMVYLFGVMGMDADCRIDGGVSPGDLQGLAALPERRTHRNDVIDPGRRGPQDNILPIPVEFSHFQMGVGVDKHALAQEAPSSCLSITVANGSALAATSGRFFRFSRRSSSFNSPALIFICRIRLSMLPS